MVIFGDSEVLEDRFSPNTLPSDYEEYESCESCSEEVVFSLQIDSCAILPLSQIITRTALLNCDFSSFYDEDMTHTHSCSICHKHGLVKIAIDYVKNILNGNTLNHPSSPQEAETLTSSIVYIIRTLKEKMHIREVEIIHACMLFQNVCKMHWQCSTFVLFRHCLSVFFLACVVISHKFSSDRHVQNAIFAKIFGIMPSTLSEIERSVLCFLDFTVYSVTVFNRLAASLPFFAGTVLPHLPLLLLTPRTFVIAQAHLHIHGNGGRDRSSKSSSFISSSSLSLPHSYPFCCSHHSSTSSCNFVCTSSPSTTPLSISTPTSAAPSSTLYSSSPLLRVCGSERACMCDFTLPSSLSPTRIYAPVATHPLLESVPLSLPSVSVPPAHPQACVLDISSTFASSASVAASSSSSSLSSSSSFLCFSSASNCFSSSLSYSPFVSSSCFFE